MRKHLVGVILCLGMLVTVMPTKTTAQVQEDNGNIENEQAILDLPTEKMMKNPQHDVSTGKIEFRLKDGERQYSANGKDDWISYDGEFAITGNSSSANNTIKINSGEHDIVLDNVKIDVSNIDDACAFDVGEGKVNIILAKGSSNVLKSGLSRAGIEVSYGGKVIITSESGNSAALEAVGGIGGAGIGGSKDNDCGDIAIQGGKINAKASILPDGFEGGAGIGGGENCNGGSITIKGGEITAVGAGGAGIGGGYIAGGGQIKIDGGIIKAASVSGGAGIGGGEGADGGEITITGGSIKATGSSLGSAAIGGGLFAGGGTIVIKGGSIDAVSINSGAGIGGGYYGNGGNVTISGGTVKAVSEYGGAGIGGGLFGSGGTVDITGGSVNAKGDCENGASNIGNGISGSDSGIVKNGITGDEVELYTFTVGSTPQNNKSFSDFMTAPTPTTRSSSNFGMEDVKTDEAGKLYFYLPKNNNYAEAGVKNSVDIYSGKVFSKEVRLASIQSELALVQPVTGNDGQTTFMDTQYKGEIAWAPALNEGKFEQNTVYTAQIKLTPIDGYSLLGVSNNYFKVAYATATNTVADGEGSIEVNVVFPKTGDIKPPSHTHEFGQVWKSDAEGHWRECPYDNEKSEYANHTAGAPVNSNGEMHSKCDICSYTMEVNEIIPPTYDHEPISPPNPKTPLDLSKDSVFAFKGDFNAVTGVSLNGNSLVVKMTGRNSAELSGYPGYDGIVGTMASGSVIITLNKNFLDVLASGEYTLDVQFNDEGQISTSSVVFTIGEKGNEENLLTQEDGTISPRTGDETGLLALWTLLTFACIVASLAFIKLYNHKIGGVK